MDTDNCPNCGFNFVGDDIVEARIKQRELWKGMSDEEIRRDVHEMYSPPYTFRNEIGIEYAYPHPGHYDGVSEWQCPSCKTRYGRWSKRVLTGDDYERPFGRET